MSYLCKSCVSNACEGCNPEDPAASNYQSTFGRQGSCYEEAAVQCPFYRRIYKKQKMIVCEGPWERTSTTTYYNLKEMMKEHMEGFCKGDYRSCRIFKIVNDEKYNAGG